MREHDPGPKSPDWFRAWGVSMIALYVSRVCIRVRGSYQVFWPFHLAHILHPFCAHS